MEMVGPHHVAIAARTETEVHDLLAEWQSHSGGARIISIELAFSRDD